MIQGVGSSSVPASSAAKRSSAGPDPAEQDQQKSTTKSTDERKRSPAEQTPDEQRLIAKLQSRDREVRAHEAAHKSVGGSLAGGMSFSYETGPDGRQYAVGGEVSIDTGAERDPQATIAKMRRVVAAALAPAQPSSQDQAIAAAARATMTQAQRDLASSDDGSTTTRSRESEQPSNAASAYGSQPEEPGRLISLIA